MNKLAFVLFSGLTAGATYLTVFDVGVQDASATYAGQSVRSGSLGNMGFSGSGK